MVNLLHQWRHFFLISPSRSSTAYVYKIEINSTASEQCSMEDTKGAVKNRGLIPVAQRTAVAREIRMLEKREEGRLFRNAITIFSIGEWMESNSIHKNIKLRATQVEEFEREMNFHPVNGTEKWGNKPRCKDQYEIPILIIVSTPIGWITSLIALFVEHLNLWN